MIELSKTVVVWQGEERRGGQRRMMVDGLKGIAGQGMGVRAERKREFRERGEIAKERENKHSITLQDKVDDCRQKSRRNGCRESRSENDEREKKEP